MDGLDYLFDKAVLPRLNHLSLNYCSDALRLVEILCGSNMCGQIEVLNLSKNHITDQAAACLLDHKSSFGNLQTLDLNYHFLTEKVVSKFRKADLKVSLSNAQTRFYQFSSGQYYEDAMG